MNKTRLITGVLAILLVFSLIGCASGVTATQTEVAPPAPAVNESAPAEEELAPPADAAAEESAQTDGYVLNPGEWVIGLSNSYYGNTWRKQMVENFNTAAETAKTAGYIADYEVQNGDGTVNAQIAQMNTFILKQVDAVCMNAASPTSLNTIIKQAYDQGIKIIAFDSIVSSPYAYTMDFDFVGYGKGVVDSIADLTGGEGNVILVRGVSGSAPDLQMFEGNEIALAGYPGLKVVATINGEASATKAQEEITKILASLPEIAGVITQGGGDAYGVAQAFEQSDQEKLPVIIGDNSGEFIQWWVEKAKEGYQTYSQGTTPSISSAALWVSLYILNGCEVPTKMMCAYYSVSPDTLSEFASTAAGTIVSPNFTPEYVVENVIKPYLMN